MIFRLATDAADAEKAIRELCIYQKRGAVQHNNEDNLYRRFLDVFGPPILVPVDGDHTKMSSPEWLFVPENRWDLFHDSVYIRLEKDVVYARLLGLI